jgi:hypothetical protein
MPRKNAEAKGPQGGGALTQAEIEGTVRRLAEAFRDFLVLLARLSREHSGSGGPQ